MPTFSNKSTPNGNPDGSLEGISYEEKFGSGSFDLSEDTITGKRMFWVSWGNRVKFSKILTGYKQTDASSDNPNGYSIKGQDFPGMENLICTKVHSEPFGKSRNNGGNPEYEWAFITALYTPKIIYDGDVKASQQIDFESEFFEFDRFSLFWGDGTPIAEKTQQRKLMPIITHTFTENYYPNLLQKKDYINSAVGLINATEYQNVEAENLLYLGATADRQFTVDDGRLAWKVTHKFKERPNESWNKVFNPESGLFESVYDSAGSVYLIYQLGDFSNLIGGNY